MNTSTIRHTLSNFAHRYSRQMLAVNSIIFLLAGYTFLKLADDVWFREGFSWDAPAMLAIHQFSRPWLDTVFIGITNSAGKYLPLIALATVAILWARRKKLEAGSLTLSLVVATAINWLLKTIFSRPRPNVFPPITVEHSYSFPSGHTMAALAFYGFLALLFWRWGYRLWALAAGIWVILVAFSRVYLGVHYPSDILGALAIGTLWLIIMEFFYFQKAKRTSSV